MGVGLRVTKELQWTGLGNIRRLRDLAYSAAITTAVHLRPTSPRSKEPPPALFGWSLPQAIPHYRRKRGTELSACWVERSLSPPRRVVRKASSASILVGMDESGEAEGGGESLLMPEPASAPPAMGDFEDTSGEVDEDEYGEVIERPEGPSKPLLKELHTEGRP